MARPRLTLKSPCWPWPTSRKDGYATTEIAGNKILVHRWLFEQLRGPIPKKATLDHLCRTRNCANPWHCEPVSLRVNILRGISPIAENAAKTHCPQGHPYNKKNTRHYQRPDGTWMRTCLNCERDRVDQRREERHARGGAQWGKGEVRVYCLMGHRHRNEKTAIECDRRSNAGS
jgi:hypothetical protein